MIKNQFLKAFDGTNTRVPVWFMRQAGRYLPQYQAIKQKYSIEIMFQTPELAAEVTCQPIDILGVDAAILFADILTLPMKMGFDIHFDSKLGPRIVPLKDLSGLHDFKEVDHVAQTIRLVNQRLPAHIPLIGFAGGPFTVLTYLVEGGSSLNYTKTLAFMHQEEASFHQLMEALTINTIAYLKLQQDAGIKVFQLFESWGGICRAVDYERLVLPYVKRIFDSIELPSIYFMRNCSHLLHLMEDTSADFLSVCHTVDIANNPILQQTNKGVQGNLYNGLLYADVKTLEDEVALLLKSARQYQRYIFNLSHGVFPNVDVEQLKRIVAQVHAFPWNA